MKKTVAILLALVMVFVMTACVGIAGIDDKPKEDRSDLKLSKSGYVVEEVGGGGYCVWFSVVLENTSTDQTCDLETLRITTKDAKGNVIATVDHQLSLIIQPGGDCFKDCVNLPADVR